MNPNSNQDDKIYRAIALADAQALLEQAQTTAKRLVGGQSKASISTTQLRATYSLVRRLEFYHDYNSVRSGLALIQARLAYLLERARIAAQNNEPGIRELSKTVHEAAMLVLEKPDEAVKRAKALVELFQAIVAYQQLFQSKSLKLNRFLDNKITPENKAKLERIIIDSDGAALFDTASWVARRSHELNLTKSQMHNIYVTLKSLQSRPFDEQTLWQLRLLEPRLLYALVREREEEALSATVRLLYDGLKTLFENGPPTKPQFNNYVRLCEALVGLQVYEREVGNGRVPLLTDQDYQKLQQGIETDDGKILVDFAWDIAQDLANANLGRSQVRNLYVTLQEFAVQNFTSQNLQELQRLRATIRYAGSQERQLQPLTLVLDAAIKLVGSNQATETVQRTRARWVTDFLEAVLASQLSLKKEKGTTPNPLLEIERNWLDQVLPDQKEASVASSLGYSRQSVAEDQVLLDQEEASVRLAYSIAKRINFKEDLSESESSSGESGRGQVRMVFDTLKEAVSSGREQDHKSLRRKLWILIPRLDYFVAQSPGLQPLTTLTKVALMKILANSELTGLEALVDLLEGVVAFHYTGVISQFQTTSEKSPKVSVVAGRKN